MSLEHDLLPWFVGFVVLVSIVLVFVIPGPESRKKRPDNDLDRSPSLVAERRVEAEVEPRPFPQDKVPGKRTRVTDGDGLEAIASGFGELRIRLAYIDAPEHNQPWGQESNNELWHFTDASSLMFKLIEQDKYGRVVAEVWSQDRCINLEMVRKGHAWAVFRRMPEYLHQQYRQARNEARRQELGLWQSNWPMPPWEWRRHLDNKGETGNIYKLKQKMKALESELELIRKNLRLDK